LLKLAVQQPTRLDASFDQLPASLFAHPAYIEIFRTIARAGGVVAAGAGSWIPRLSDAAADDSVRSVITELAVDPIHVDDAGLDRYAREQLGRARERVVTLRIDELRSRMQRLESEDPAGHAAAFAELVTLEAERRQLREEAYGGD
jgi:DNA primase